MTITRRTAALTGTLAGGFGEARLVAQTGAPQAGPKRVFESAGRWGHAIMDVLSPAPRHGNAPAHRPGAATSLAPLLDHLGP